MSLINIIGMPMNYGCYVNGANLAPKEISKILPSIFPKYNLKMINTNYNVDINNELSKKIKFKNEVLKANSNLYKEVYNSLNDKVFPLTIGGDHSSAIGSVSASLDYTKGDLTVIWIDSHLDIHTDITTPSGNIHGMPLSICIGRCQDNDFNTISNYHLNPNNLYYIGANSYEKEEIEYAKASCNIFNDDEVNQNVDNVLENIVKNITTKYCHISFDLDVLLTSEFPAVNVNIQKSYLNNGGITIKKAKYILSFLLDNLNVISMDVVEYNPILDKDEKYLNIIKEFLEIIKNKKC